MPEFYAPIDVTGAITQTGIVLADAPVIALDVAQGNMFTLTLGGDHELGTPENPADGQKILIAVTQDGSGSRTLSYNDSWEFSDALPQPTLSLSAGKTDYLGFIYSSTASVWRLLAFLSGF